MAMIENKAKQLKAQVSQLMHDLNNHSTALAFHLQNAKNSSNLFEKDHHLTQTKKSLDAILMMVQMMSNFFIQNQLIAQHGKEPTMEMFTFTRIKDLLEKIFHKMSTIGIVQQQVQFDTRSQFICVDKKKLELIFMNLFLKVMRARPGHAICKVDIRVWDSNDKKLCILVHDKGMVIKDDKLYANNELVMAKTKIADLGLPVCRQIVSELGGTMEITHPNQNIFSKYKFLFKFPLSPLKPPKSIKMLL